ncbi:hypothetical protein E2C01_091161 [Portunus trituberculatus]|uniref:Uncharacterized protein n=1 Tax=Portunus trituberculatus TaxID=210409 RepID=A0A5B7JIF6_PORTR|nr:hypothetical protein [Portunus trituberculatus]
MKRSANRHKFPSSIPTGSVTDHHLTSKSAPVRHSFVLAPASRLPNNTVPVTAPPRRSLSVLRAMGDSDFLPVK